MLIFIYACFLFFFFTYPPTTVIYTLSLHDALPILHWNDHRDRRWQGIEDVFEHVPAAAQQSIHTEDAMTHGIGHQNKDRKSTRLNSSYRCISYAVFCLKKKKKKHKQNKDLRK